MSLKNFLLFVLILCGQNLAAQDPVPANIVYLNDDSFLKGTILSETPFRIELQLTDGSVIQLSKGNIKSIEKNEENIEILSNGNRRKDKGHYHVLYVGLLVAQSTRSGLRLGANLFHFIKGYQFNPHFGVGAGVGIDLYQREFLPIFLDIRGKILNRSTSLYYALNTGYTLGIAKEEQFTVRNYNGGFMIHPSIGLQFSSRKKHNFLVEVGYRHQYASVDNGNDEVEKWIYRRISIRGAVMF